MNQQNQDLQKQLKHFFSKSKMNISQIYTEKSAVFDKNVSELFEDKIMKFDESMLY